MIGAENKMDDNRGIMPKPPKDPLENARAASKKRAGRYAYLNDIHRTANGKEIYTGPCFKYDTAVNTRASVVLKLLLLALPAFAACVISGCFNVPFMRDTWYTVVPFGFELVSLGSVLWAACRILCNKDVVRDYIKKQTFGALPLRCLLSVIFSACGLIGGTVFMLCNGTMGEAARCFAYIALKAVSIVCAAFIAFIARNVKWADTEEKI